MVAAFSRPGHYYVRYVRKRIKKYEFEPQASNQPKAGIRETKKNSASHYDDDDDEDDDDEDRELDQSLGCSIDDPTV